MPSVSKKQQKFMGIVRAIQKGEADPSDFNKDAQDAAKKMKKSSVKKYAKTKHKGLPTKKVNEKVNKELKRIYQLLLKYGNSRKDAMNMIKKNMKYVNKTYSGSSPRDKAMALVGLSSLGESMTKSQIKKMRDEFDKTGELPPHLKKIVKAKKEFEKKFKVKDIVVPGLEWMSKLGEAKKRDYKAEYKKFQSSTKAKKYRAELNKYNRQKGTYGNGDGKDASHKGGKIVGFESQSKNRGRAEKSRLKKEIVDYVDSIIDEDTITFSKKEMDQLHKGKLKKGDDEYIYKEDIYLEDIVNENPAAIAAAQRMVVQNKAGKKVSVMTAKNKSYKDKDPSAHQKAKSIFQRIKDKFKKKNESINEGGMELKKLEDAIKMFQKKIKKQGMVTNARDEEHLKRLMKIYNDMGGKKIKENNELFEWLYEACWKGYEKKGMKKMFGKMYPNCVKKTKKKESVEEGSCGYGIDGKLGEEPAGPHLLKKKKKKNMKEASSNDVKRAIQIAKSMGGNMTGAVKKIEKMKKGLTKHKDVKNALKKANEGLADKFMKNIDKYNKKAKKSKDYLKKLKKKKR